MGARLREGRQGAAEAILRDRSLATPAVSKPLSPLLLLCCCSEVHAAHAWGSGGLALGCLHNDALGSGQQGGHAGGIHKRCAHDLQAGRVDRARRGEQARFGQEERSTASGQQQEAAGGSNQLKQNWEAA